MKDAAGHGSNSRTAPAAHQSGIMDKLMTPEHAKLAAKVGKVLLAVEGAQAAIGTIGGLAWAVHHVYFGG